MGHSIPVPLEFWKVAKYSNEITVPSNQISANTNSTKNLSQKQTAKTRLSY